MSWVNDTDNPTMGCLLYAVIIGGVCFGSDWITTSVLGIKDPKAAANTAVFLAVSAFVILVVFAVLLDRASKKPK